MSFPNDNKLVSALPETTRLRIQQLAQRLNRSEEDVAERLMNSFLDLLENPESMELTGLAKETREKLYPRRSSLH